MSINEPLQIKLRAATPGEAGIFYALPPEKDEQLGTIGHVRIDFGNGGRGFYHTWWPRGPQELNTLEFRAELGQVVDVLRLGVLKDLESMRCFCREMGGGIAGGSCTQNYGYVVETDRYRYCLRCNPIEGDYQAYLTCFDLRTQELNQSQEQKMGLTEKGRQMLRDAADPAKPHDYRWYVIEHINDSQRRVDHELSLEEAVQMYTSLDCEDKRLGVTKDGIATVDLIIRLDGREWFPKDREKLDSFSTDNVVAGAVERLQQALSKQEPEQGITMGGMNL